MIHADTDIELPAEQIKEVVSMHLQDLLSCYEESLEEKHDETFSMDSNMRLVTKILKTTRHTLLVNLRMSKSSKENQWR